MNDPVGLLLFVAQILIAFLASLLLTLVLFELAARARDDLERRRIRRAR